MNSRFTFFVLLVLVVALTACQANIPSTPTLHGDPLAFQPSPVTSTPQGDPATPTPEVFNPLDPSPTPSGSGLPLTCQITDLMVYMNQAEGYCFAYPKRFREGEQPWIPNRPGILGPAVGSQTEPVNALFVVEVTAYDSQKSLDQQADSFLKDFTVVDIHSMTRARIIVGGEAALLVEAVPVQLSWRIVFVHHNGRLYRLMYWPVDLPEAQADLEELYQTTLNSFAFLRAK